MHMDKYKKSTTNKQTNKQTDKQHKTIYVIPYLHKTQVISQRYGPNKKKKRKLNSLHDAQKATGNQFICKL